MKAHRQNTTCGSMFEKNKSLYVKVKHEEKSILKYSPDIWSMIIRFLLCKLMFYNHSQHGLFHKDEQSRRQEQCTQTQTRMHRRGMKAKSVWGSHLGQEVRRLSSYAFQNERGFLVQIGVLGWRRRWEGRIRAEEETKYREVSARWFCEAY